MSMNIKEFEAKLRLSGRHLLTELLEGFVSYYRKSGEKLFSLKDVADSIELAGHMTLKLRAADALKERKPQKPLKKRLAKDRLITNKLMLNTIKQQIRELRMELYKTADPPYTKQDIEEILSYAQVKRVPISELAEFTREEIELAFEGQKPEQAIQSVWSSKKLLQFAEELSRQTPISEDELLLFILTDIKPKLEPYKVTLHPETPLTPFETFSVDIFTNRVTWEMMRAILREIKKLGPKQLIKPKQMTLLEVIEELGGVPDRGQNVFWMRVLKRCRSLGVKEWTSSDAPRKCYKRLQDKRLVD